MFIFQLFFVLPRLPTRYLTASVGMMVTDLVTVWIEVVGLMSCLGVSFLWGFSSDCLTMFVFSLGPLLMLLAMIFSCLGCDMVAVFFEDVV